MESSDTTHQHHHTPIALSHLDAIAHTLGIPVSYLFIPPHGTPEERVILAMLEVNK